MKIFPNIKRVPVYKLRVVYKNGYIHEFEVTEFNTQRSGAYSWTALTPDNKPLKFGSDDIMAIYQIGMRHKIQWRSPE